MYCPTTRHCLDHSAPFSGTVCALLQVQPISTKEKGLQIAAGICICVGPLIFTAFMLREFVFMKKRV